jgi:hypothetical protein
MDTGTRDGPEARSIAPMRKMPPDDVFIEEQSRYASTSGSAATRSPRAFGFTIGDPNCAAASPGSTSSCAATS